MRSGVWLPAVWGQVSVKLDTRDSKDIYWVNDGCWLLGAVGKTGLLSRATVVQFCWLLDIGPSVMESSSLGDISYGKNTTTLLVQMACYECRDVWRCHQRDSLPYSLQSAHGHSCSLSLISGAKHRISLSNHPVSRGFILLSPALPWPLRQTHLNFLGNNRWSYSLPTLHD